MRKSGLRNHRSARSTLPGTAVILISLLVAVPSRADTFSPEAGRSFFNDIIPLNQQHHHIPGVGVALVHNGKVVFLGGYGQADLDKRVPVDPKYAVFRCGSVSKLITVTAVMQLAERRLLDLHRDLNIYLTRFVIPAAYRDPVTLHHLLTHTAGFDERFIGMASRDEASSPSLGDYLSRRMPPRVMPPGVLFSYSNHGIALAGLIVEEVSGMDFEDYARRYIFDPIKMADSSFVMTTRLRENLAVGYDFRGGRYLAVKPDSLRQIAPAGSLYSTPLDMARFMIMILNRGRYERSRLLSEGSTREIQRRHFTHNPGMDGIAYDYFEETRYGPRGLYHTGSWEGFSAMLYLLPERNIGIFIATNRTSHVFLNDVIKLFHNEFFPVRTGRSSPKPGTIDTTDRLCGTYRHLRYSRMSIAKLGSLFQHASVSRDRAHTLRVRFPEPAKETSLWVETGPLFFRAAAADEYIAFRTSGTGKATHLFRGTDAYERISWYETVPVQFTLFGFFLVTTAAVSLGIPLYRRKQLRRKDTVSPSGIPGRHPAIITATGWCCFIGLAGILLTFLLVNPFDFTREIPLQVHVFLALLSAGAVLTVLQGFFLIRFRDITAVSRPWRWFAPLVFLLFILEMLFLSSWNLLGFNY